MLKQIKMSLIVSKEGYQKVRVQQERCFARLRNRVHRRNGVQGGRTSFVNVSNALGSGRESRSRRVMQWKSSSSSSSSVASQRKEEYEFGGALATMVLGAALLSERLNGKGIIASLELEHHDMMHPILLFSVISLVAAALWPSQRSLEEATGGMMSTVNSANENGGSLMKKGEERWVVIGKTARGMMSRIAYLGLAGSIAAEMYTGRGLLALLDVETGVEALTEMEAGLAFLTMILLTNGQNSRPLK